MLFLSKSNCLGIPTMPKKERGDKPRHVDVPACQRPHFLRMRGTPRRFPFLRALSPAPGRVRRGRVPGLNLEHRTGAFSSKPVQSLCSFLVGEMAQHFLRGKGHMQVLFLSKSNCLGIPTMPKKKRGDKPRHVDVPACQRPHFLRMRGTPRRFPFLRALSPAPGRVRRGRVPGLNLEHRTGAFSSKPVQSLCSFLVGEMAQHFLRGKGHMQVLFLSKSNCLGIPTMPKKKRGDKPRHVDVPACQRPHFLRMRGTPRRFPFLRALSPAPGRVRRGRVPGLNLEHRTGASLRRGHANLLCIVPILVYVLPKQVHLTLEIDLIIKERIFKIIFEQLKL